MTHQILHPIYPEILLALPSKYIQSDPLSPSPGDHPWASHRCPHWVSAGASSLSLCFHFRALGNPSTARGPLSLFTSKPSVGSYLIQSQGQRHPLAHKALHHLALHRLSDATSFPSPWPPHQLPQGLLFGPPICRVCSHWGLHPGRFSPQMLLPQIITQVSPPLPQSHPLLLYVCALCSLSVRSL